MKSFSKGLCILIGADAEANYREDACHRRCNPIHNLIINIQEDNRYNRINQNGQNSTPKNNPHLTCFLSFF